MSNFYTVCLSKRTGSRLCCGQLNTLMPKCAALYWTVVLKSMLVTTLAGINSQISHGDIKNDTWSNIKETDDLDVLLDRYLFISVLQDSLDASQRVQGRACCWSVGPSRSRSVRCRFTRPRRRTLRQAVRQLWGHSNPHCRPEQTCLR